MEKIIVAFRSRAHTVRFYNYLREMGINGIIVSTPKEAGVGCGLSVEVDFRVYPYVQKALNNTKLSSFAGCFSVKTLGDKRTVRSI